jgi:hypothetical protein
MKLASAAIALAFLIASPEFRYFRYERPIQIPGQQAGQACLAIEPEVFVHAAPQLADLRLYADDTETPYTIRVATSIEGGRKAVPILNAGVRDGQTVFDAEMPDTHYSDLQLVVTARNFIATAVVTGSHIKSGNLDTKLGEFTLFDLSRQRLGRSTVLHLPDSNFPYLHFRIAGPLRPEDITGLSVERLPATQPHYRTVAETSQAVQRDHSTVLEFTVPAHMPVDRIAFEPGATPAAFSRDVTVSAVSISEKQADDQTPPPQPVTSNGSLLRIHKVQNGKRIDEERLAIDAPRDTFGTPSRWTVTIANGDDAPLLLKSVRLEMLERTLCFDASANAVYKLRYGDAALAVPQYDYARLFVPQANALEANAGQERLNPVWQPRPDERPFTERHRILLWAALVAVIALLAAIAFKQRPGSKAA